MCKSTDEYRVKKRLMSLLPRERYFVKEIEAKRLHDHFCCFRNVDADEGSLNFKKSKTNPRKAKSRESKIAQQR